MRILLRVLDSIFKLFLAQDVDICMVQPVPVAGIQDTYKVGDAVILIAAKAVRGDRIRQRNAVKGIIIIKLAD